MNTHPDNIRSDIDAVLAELPTVDLHSTESAGGDADFGIDIDQVGRRLEEAHRILVRALEWVEKG